MKLKKISRTDGSTEVIEMTEAEFMKKFQYEFKDVETAIEYLKNGGAIRTISFIYEFVKEVK